MIARISILLLLLGYTLCPAQAPKDTVKAKVVAPAEVVPPMAIVIRQVAPNVPADSAKEPGRVKLEVQVDSMGQFAGATVVFSQPKGKYDHWAIDAAKQSQFKSPHIQGRPIAGIAKMAYDFGTKPPPPPAAETGQENKNEPYNVTNLEPLKQVKPDYPKEQLAKGISGKVEVQVFIDTLGNVIQSKIGTTSPAGVFDSVSIIAARQWKFKPRTVNGRPVQSMITIPFIYDSKTGATSSATPRMPGGMHGATTRTPAVHEAPPGPNAGGGSQVIPIEPEKKK